MTGRSLAGHNMALGLDTDDSASTRAESDALRQEFQLTDHFLVEGIRPQRIVRCHLGGS
jgi:hypothetical protein